MDAGSTLGRYLIQQQISSNKLTDIYKGYREDLKRYVIIRVFKGLPGQTRPLEGRAAQVFKSLANLRHANISDILDYGRCNDLLYFVTDDVPLTSLRDRKGSLSFKRAIEIVTQTGRALSFAHKAGIVHGNVNPENILFDKNGQPLLANFETDAVSSLYPSLDIVEQNPGASEYRSPEQRRGQPAGLRSDIYALGKMLQEYVVRLPQAPDTKKRVEQIRRVVQKATHRSPQKRFQSVDLMLAALALADACPQPSAVFEPGQNKKPIFLWSLIALAVLVVGGIISAWIWVPGISDTIQVFLLPTSASPKTWILSATPTAAWLASPRTMTPAPALAATLAPEPTLSPTSTHAATPIPTCTSTSTPTPMPTATNTPTLTPTPPAAVANLASTIFEAPLDSSRQLGIVEAKESVPILGRANEQQFGKWLYVRNSQDIEGFAFAPRFTYTVDWQSLKIITPTVTVVP